MRIKDGFPGQRLRVLPANATRAASAVGLTAKLLVTDAGYFPHASSHGRTRQHGADGTIVIVCTSGRGYCRTAHGLLRVDDAQALVIRRGLAHEYWADTRSPWTIWWMHITGSDAVAFEDELRLRSAGHGSSPPGAVVVDVHDLLRVATHIEHVVDAMETDETMPNLLRASGAAWAAIADLVADAVSGDPVRREPVQAAQDYLRAHLDAPVQVGELASRFGLSTSHFAALFRAATGGGVIEYVRHLRMARARELLLTTGEAVAEIARVVGYPDPFYFSRHFRAAHGCSPTQFRRHSQGGEPGEQT